MGSAGQYFLGLAFIVFGFGLILQTCIILAKFLAVILMIIGLAIIIARFIQDDPFVEKDDD